MSRLILLMILMKHYLPISIIIQLSYYFKSFTNVYKNMHFAREDVQSRSAYLHISPLYKKG